MVLLYIGYDLNMSLKVSCARSLKALFPDIEVVEVGR